MQLVPLSDLVGTVTICSTSWAGVALHFDALWKVIIRGECDTIVDEDVGRFVPDQTLSRLGHVKGVNSGSPSLDCNADSYAALCCVDGSSFVVHPGLVSHTLCLPVINAFMTTQLMVSVGIKKWEDLSSTYSGIVDGHIVLRGWIVAELDECRHFGGR